MLNSLSTKLGEGHLHLLDEGPIVVSAQGMDHLRCEAVNLGLGEISSEEGSIVSKRRKYTTRNPINRYFVSNYFSKIDKLLSDISFKSVLDIGCGEGIVLHHIQEHLVGKHVSAMDINPKEIETAKNNIPFAKCGVASAYALPFSNSEFDLVICCEVLEHLHNLDLALREIRRVTAKYCIFSVPNEPIWRLVNIARGTYIVDLGNTPGHVNHWSSKAFQRYISDYFQVVKTISPFPWVGVLCRQKDKLGNFT